MKKAILVILLFITGIAINAEVIEKFIGHYMQINDISTFNNQEKVVTVGQDEKIIIWNVNNNTVLSELEVLNGDPFTAVTVINNGEKIVAGTEYGMLWVFDSQLKKQYDFKLHEGKITDICYLKNEGIIVTGSEDGYVKFIDITKRNVSKEHNFKDAVTSLDVSKDSETITAGSAKGIIYVIEGENEFNVISVITTDEESPVKAISFSGDSRYFVSVGYRNTINLYSTRNGRKLNNIKLEGVKSIYSISWNANEDIIGVGSDKRIHFLRPKFGSSSKVLEEVKLLPDISKDVNEMIFDENEKIMYTISEDTHFRVWDIEKNVLLKSFSSY